MINSIDDTDATLTLAGPWKGKHDDLSDKINYLGVVSRSEINNIYKNSIAGLLLYQPAGNHFESQPIKMFEYMAAGLPIICSDFPLWKEIVEGNGCGICVNPADTNAVTNAVNLILNDKNLAAQMGKSGHEAALEKYNWTIEEKKLLSLYTCITK